MKMEHIKFPDEVFEEYGQIKAVVSERRESFDRFIHFLEEKTSWLTSPASTRFHMCVEGGLLAHSVGVTQKALELKNLLAQDISDESVVIVALFHDIGKVGYAGKPYYLLNDSNWELRERGIPYRVNPEIIAMPIAVRSLYLVSQYIPLTEAEAQSIVAHDGLYPVKGGVANLEYHHKECRLQMIIHFADKWMAAVEE